MGFKKNYKSNKNSLSGQKRTHIRVETSNVNGKVVTPKMPVRTKGIRPVKEMTAPTSYIVLVRTESGQRFRFSVVNKKLVPRRDGYMLLCENRTVLKKGDKVLLVTPEGVKISATIVTYYKRTRVKKAKRIGLRAKTLEIKAPAYKRGPYAKRGGGIEVEAGHEPPEDIEGEH